MSEHIKIAARPPRRRYRADGAQRVFAFDFAVFRPEDIEIRIDDAALAGGYSVAINATGTGAATLDVAPPDGAIVVVRRRLVVRRETDFQEGGELRAKTLNDELDFQTAALQQVETQAARALHLPDDDPDEAGTRLPRAALRAGRALVFDAAGDPAVSADLYDDQAAASAASAASAAGSADEARTSATAADAARVAAGNSAAAASEALAAVAVSWAFAASTAPGDPGVGNFRFDAATPAAAGALAVSNRSFDSGNPDLSDFVAAWDDSTNPTGRGFLTIRKRGAPEIFAVYLVQSVVDNGTWLQVGVAHVASAGTWAAADPAYFAFARTGDKGLDGTGSVVSVAAGDASVAIGGTAANPTLAVAANAVTGAKLAREGSAGQVLTSNGAGANPTYQNPPAGVPAGTVVPYAGTVEPAGWLFAAGQAVSRAAYAALFAAIGTAFGAGDGTTSFNLPDLRGRVAAGRDNMNGTPSNRLTAGGSGIAGATLGAAGGAETHMLTAAQMPAHVHSESSVAGGTVVEGWHGEGAPAASVAGGGSGGTTGSAGSGAAHPNAQPTLVLNHIVKT